jgi:hypothetical protein
MENGKRESCCLKRRPRIIPYASLLRCRDKDVIEIVNLANVLFRKFYFESQACATNIQPTFNGHLQHLEHQQELLDSFAVF